jgi:hypothetical protein
LDAACNYYFTKYPIYCQLNSKNQNYNRLTTAKESVERFALICVNDDLYFKINDNKILTLCFGEYKYEKKNRERTHLRYW